MRKHGWFRPHVRGLTAISSTTLREGGGWWLAGSQLDLDFANDRSYNRKTGYNATPNGLLTYTSPSPKMVYGDDGVLGYARHNLLPNSIWGGAYSGDDWTPTSWVYGAVTGTGTAQPSAASATDTAIRFATSGGAQREFLTVTLSAVAGDRFRFSFDLETVTNAISWNQLFTVPSLGAVVETYNGETTVGSDTPIGVGSRIYVDFNVATSGTLTMRLGVGCSSNTNGDIVVSRPMLQKLPFVGQEYLRNTSTSAAKYDLPIDHDPLTGEALGVLIEEQRTNLLTYSQEFDNAAWTKDELTVSANAIVAPDGTTTADKLIPSTKGAASHRARQAYTFSAISYSYSVYVKAAGYSWVKLRFASVWANINVSTGEVGFSSGATVTLEDVGDGWYRCIVVGTAAAGASFMYAYAMSSNENSIDPTAWSGNGTSGIYVWGAQLEAGAFATSYIQTGSAQVTRAADQVSLATSAFAYNVAEGTLATESDVNQDYATAFSYIWSLSDNTSTERTVARTLFPTANFAVVDGGVTQAAFGTAGTIVAKTPFKMASAYKANDFAASLDGGTVGTDVSGTLPAVTTLRFGSDAFSTLPSLNGHIKRLTYWNSRKPDAELQALSA